MKMEPDNYYSNSVIVKGERNYIQINFLTDMDQNTNMIGKF